MGFTYSVRVSATEDDGADAVTAEVSGCDTLSHIIARCLAAIHAADGDDCESPVWTLIAALYSTGLPAWNEVVETCNDDTDDDRRLVACIRAIRAAIAEYYSDDDFARG